MLFRARQLQPLRGCRVRLHGATGVELVFDKPQRAVTKGQVVALYSEEGNVCLGGGIISSRGPSCHELGEAVTAPKPT